MSSTKEKALAKMLEEMNQEHSSTEDTIHNWLCDQDDEELFAGILDKKKSIKESVLYCGSQARELAMRGVAMVEDAQVFEWVQTFFKTPDIAFDKPNLQDVTKSASKPKRPKKAKKATVPEGEQLDLLDFI